MTTMVNSSPFIVLALRYAGEEFIGEGVFAGNPIFETLPQAKSYIWPVYQDILAEMNDFFYTSLGREVDFVQEAYLEYEKKSDTVIVHAVLSFTDEDHLYEKKVSIVKNKELFLELLRDLSLIPSLSKFNSKYYRGEKVNLLDEDSGEPLFSYPVIIELVIKRENKYTYILRGFPIEEESEVEEELLVPYVEKA